jgi:DNA primase
MSLSPQFLDEIRARTSLSTVIGRTVKLQRAGREWKAPCPFHKEKTPSFYVNDEKSFYHCFGCGVHGDAIRWLTDARGMPFMDAVKELADAAGMEVPAADPRAAERAERATGLYDVMSAAQRWFEEQLAAPDGGAARAYLESRGILPETRQRFGFGYAPDARNKLKDALKQFGQESLVDAGLLIIPEEGREPYDRFRGRITFPIRDRRGRVIAFSARILGSGEPKYLNSPDTPLFEKGRTLFNIDRAAVAARDTKRVIVVEGQMDVIALDQAGYPEAVAPLGTAVTEIQLQALWKLSETPIFCFDGDSAGQKAAGRAAHRALPLLAPGKSLAFGMLPPGQDPDDLIKEGGKAAFDDVLSKVTPLSDFLWQSEVTTDPLTTPENRAALGKRVRDLARSIPDEDVRIQYLGFFNGRLTELFQQFRPNTPGARHHTFLKTRALPPEMLAIADMGIDQAVMTRAVLQGLRRYPNVIAQTAEAIALIWMRNRRYAQVREVMLIATLETWPLDRGTLESKLKGEGLADTLQSLKKPRELAFSFLREGAKESVAECDLGDVIEKLTAGATLNVAIKEAKRRLQMVEGVEWDDAFRELERLYDLQRTSEDEMRDFRPSREAADQDSEA